MKTKTLLELLKKHGVHVYDNDEALISDVEAEYKNQLSKLPASVTDEIISGIIDKAAHGARHEWTSHDEEENGKGALIKELRSLLNHTHIPLDWWDDQRFIELKNAHLDIICKGILEYNGTGKFGSPELQKIADIVYGNLNHPPVMGEGEKEQQIFFTYDRRDGEVFCAFTDKEWAKRDADECGAGMGETRLIIGKRTPPHQANT